MVYLFLYIFIKRIKTVINLKNHFTTFKSDFIVNSLKNIVILQQSSVNQKKKGI